MSHTQSDYPRNKTIHQVFEDQVAVCPHAAAVQFRDNTWTYAELNGKANLVSDQLRRLGAGPGDLVGLCVERSLDLVAAILGILKTGCAYVPLDPEYPAARLKYMLEHAGAGITVCSDSSAIALSGLSGSTKVVRLDLKGSQSDSSENPCSGATALDTAYLMYTSGSTGKPKGVIVNHRAVVRLVKNTNYCDFGSNQVFLQLAPLSFDASTFEIWGPLLNGGRLVMMPPGAVSLWDIGEAIRRYGITTMWLTAGLFHLMVDQRLDDLRPLTQLLAGGDVLSPKHVRLLLERIPSIRLINGYGPTEGTTFTCCYPMSGANPPKGNVAIGVPVSNTTVYVLNDNLEPVPIGESGELYIGGDGVSQGYWNDPIETSQKFVPNPFSKEPNERLYRTGDLVRYRNDGLLEFLGRIDQQVKISGYRIELGEIEAILHCHSAVQQAVVVAREQAGREKCLVAYVVPSIHRETLADELLQSISQALPAYMLPSAIVLMESMPLSPNGKLERSLLPEPQQHRTLGATSQAPEPSLETQICEIWKKVLHLESVGRDNNFFDLGGDSLGLIEVHAEIQKTFGDKLTITDLFEHTTVRTLARHLKENSGSKADLSVIDERAERQRRELARQKLLKALGSR